MNRWTLAVAVVFITLAIGCSNDSVSPLSPIPDLTRGSVTTTGAPQTNLWGYWDLYFDLENGTVEAVPNHQAEFAANVVSFLNSKGGLGFLINETIPGTGFVDVDINVSLTHPLPGMTQYNGYDVRGIFMGNGTQTLKYDTQLKATNRDDEQYMLDDPDDGDGGGQDGYTRWWNPDEFTAPGLLGYTPGKAASPGYIGSATLNAYKYFADGLSATEDLWAFLSPGTGEGVFSSGATNTRNYYLRFPTPLPGVKYCYAVVASWKSELPADHPANATEAQGINVVIEPDLYYVNGTSKGGDFIADISVFDWGSKVAPTGEMDDYLLHIETELNTTVYNATVPDMTPVGGTANYSTYHIEFTPNNLTFNSVGAGHDAEYWVIVEYPDAGYEYPEAPAPPAPTDTLAAFFRFNDLFVSNVPYNAPPVIESGVTGEDNPLIIGVEVYTVVASDPDGDSLTYSWDVSDGLLNNDPGNGDGTIDIDWGDLGAVDLGEYDIDCMVSDGSDETPATTLTVTGTAVIYLYDGTVDDGGMSTIGFGAGPANWTFLAGQDVWDENGNTTTEDTNMCRTLATPAIDFPAGASNVKIEIKHSMGIANYYGYYSMGSGMVGYTTDGGTSINFDKAPCSYSATWLTYVSGQNFNHSYPYGNLGFYQTYYLGCDPWSYSWNNSVFVDTFGSVASPSSTVWNAPSLAGKSNVKIGFNYNHCMYNWGGIQTGWQIREIKITIVP